MKKTIRNQILDYLKQELTPNEIAAKLNISKHTVKSYIISLTREGIIKTPIINHPTLITGGTCPGGEGRIST